MEIFACIEAGCCAKLALPLTDYDRPASSPALLGGFANKATDARHN